MLLSHNHNTQQEQIFIEYLGPVTGQIFRYHNRNTPYNHKLLEYMLMTIDHILRPHYKPQPIEHHLGGKITFQCTIPYLLLEIFRSH